MKNLKAKIKKTLEQKTLIKNWDRYRGYIVLVVEDHIFATKRGDRVAKLIQKIETQFNKKPLITVIPKEGFWILPQRS